MRKSHFFPVYEEASALDLPLCIHTGHPLPGDEWDRGFPIMHSFTEVVKSRLPENFPNLRFGFIEAGASWIPYMVSQVGAHVRQAERGLEKDLPGLYELAPELFRTNRAGDEFYDHLARLRADQHHAREIYYLCLALGFEGRYAGHDAERAELMRQQFELLRASGHALDLATVTPLAPPAYELAIHVRGRGGKRLWPVLLAWIGAAAAVFGLLWVSLRWLAAGVPAPPGS